MRVRKRTLNYVTVPARSYRGVRECVSMSTHVSLVSGGRNRVQMYFNVIALAFVYEFSMHLKSDTAMPVQFALVLPDPT